MKRLCILGLCASVSLLVTGAVRAANPSLPRFDFAQAESMDGWKAAHDITSITSTPDGLLIRISGPDPYMIGPARDLPAGQLLWVKLRLKSDEAGTLQVFYFRDATREKDSVRAAVRAGVWEDLHLPLPALGAGYRLRIDPPGVHGECLLASVAFEERVVLKEPEWPRPEPPRVAADAARVASGPLLLTHAPNELGGFSLSIEGKPTATGNNRPLIGYLHDGQQHWLDLKTAAKVRLEQKDGAIELHAAARDEGGADWRIEQRFAAAKQAGAIDVVTRVAVSQDRAVVWLPLLTLLPGAGSFGQTKAQAILPGLEYLDKDEPSSSEADIIGPGARRRTPDSLKITIPMMAVAADGRYAGLIWEPQADVSALFDSPDRTFKSGGHLIGLLWPGSNGRDRVEGDPLPHEARLIPGNKPIELRATLIGGVGASVVPAVQRYVALRGLPPAPDPKLDLKGYVTLTTAGWLDSKLREGSRYRHAVGGSFGAHPAADAALFIDWLASKADGADRDRLHDAAGAALAEVPPANYDSSAVGHVRIPAQSLLYGHVAENVAAARGQGKAMLGRFEGDGFVRYRAGKEDFGKTHFAPDANGLTGQVVVRLLECAAITGDAELIDSVLKHLRAMDKFANTVPRGAQTWEVPLHTPDILASAHLVRAYTLGYQMTGDERFLEQARYWAWTGVPFVYLVQPRGAEGQPVGPYATIPVLGATNWVAPNWMGLPVQWCGLVYADALYRLDEIDPAGPWKRLADGITASGIQQTVPLDGEPAHRGLLPDSYVLRTGERNGAFINPGTLEPNAVRFYGQTQLYDLHVTRKPRWFIHAPGQIADVKQDASGVRFSVMPWREGEYAVLISGCATAPHVRIDGADAAPADAGYARDDRYLVIKLRGKAKVEVSGGGEEPRR